VFLTYNLSKASVTELHTALICVCFRQTLGHKLVTGSIKFFTVQSHGFLWSQDYGHPEGVNGKTAHFMAVHATDDLVGNIHSLSLGSAALLTRSIVQIVGVNDAHNVLKLVRPAPPVVVPV